MRNYKTWAVVAMIMASTTVVTAQTEADMDIFSFMRYHSSIQERLYFEDMMPKWRFSIGAGVRVGMKIGQVSGGTFDVPSTGGVNNTPHPSDPDYTTDWWADSDARISKTGNLIGGSIPEWQLHYTRNDLDNGDASATGAGILASLSRDFMWEPYYTLGLRMSFASYFGMKATKSAATFDVINLFEPSTGTGADPSIHGPATLVAITPIQNNPLEKSEVDVSATLIQIGIGPEILLHEEEDGWIRLSLYPALLLNYTSTSVDATTTDMTTGISTSASGSGSGFLVGAGLTASAIFDLTEDWALYGSFGFEFLPKKSISAGDFDLDVNYSGLTLGISASYSF